MKYVLATILTGCIFAWCPDARAGEPFTDELAILAVSREDQTNALKTRRLKKEVTISEAVGVLTTFKKVTREQYLVYDHLVGGARGTVTLKDGKTYSWVIERAYAATVKDPQGETTYLLHPKLKGGISSWNAKQFEGAFTFAGPDAFRQYLLAGDAIAVGKLLQWDGDKGSVQIERLLRGKLEKKVSFVAEGGTVTARPGDRVIVVLKIGKDRSRLHSFCAAPGLYKHTDELLQLVVSALPAREREAGKSPENRGAKDQRVRKNTKVWTDDYGNYHKEVYRAYTKTLKDEGGDEVTIEIRHGKATEYHENGNKALEGDYRDGKRDGEFTFWSENGVRTGLAIFRRGRVHGPYAEWSRDGRKMREETYENGKRHGASRWWDRDGNPLTTGTYRHDVPWDGTFPEVHTPRDRPSYWLIRHYEGGKKGSDENLTGKWWW